MDGHDGHRCDDCGYSSRLLQDSGLPPWVAYLAEFLQHGIWHLTQDSEKDRRLALITIDGAVEMMIRTFLILPEHVTGLRLTREQRDSVGEGFTDLLDALRRFVPDRVPEAELNDIESYHRCRNELSRDDIEAAPLECHRVEAYGVLASRLFTALFGYELAGADETEPDLTGWMQ